MKSNTLVSSQTQVRIRQLKLGVDWHADHLRVARMCDGGSPQPAQRFSPSAFLAFVQKSEPDHHLIYLGLQFQIRIKMPQEMLEKGC